MGATGEGRGAVPHPIPELRHCQGSRAPRPTEFSACVGEPSSTTPGARCPGCTDASALAALAPPKYPGPRCPGSTDVSVRARPGKVPQGPGALGLLTSQCAQAEQSDKQALGRRAARGPEPLHPAPDGPRRRLRRTRIPVLSVLLINCAVTHRRRSTDGEGDHSQ